MTAKRWGSDTDPQRLGVVGPEAVTRRFRELSTAAAGFQRSNCMDFGTRSHTAPSPGGLSAKIVQQKLGHADLAITLGT